MIILCIRNLFKINLKMIQYSVLFRLLPYKLKQNGLENNFCPYGCLYFYFFSAFNTWIKATFFQWLVKKILIYSEYMHFHQMYNFLLSHLFEKTMYSGLQTESKYYQKWCNLTKYFSFGKTTYCRKTHFVIFAHQLYWWKTSV